MCGIFGYLGQKNSKNIIIDGLKRLEYRGYDSWGIAVLNNGEISQYKNVGEIQKDKGFDSLPKGYIGLGHTRW
ncbi:glutamine--fructose-6-phosphate transaminase (isomerizing), partial [Candidatus Microgenomates bacterium]|nr:glutamine--fructose-6-phosphate transaminase (isomerizing) [Candidatus Microgenomates bacterium]